MLNDMVLCEELFHTPSGVAFADFITEGHRETWPIRSKRFRTWLRRCYYHASGSAPSAAAVRSALDFRPCQCVPRSNAGDNDIREIARCVRPASEANPC